MSRNNTGNPIGSKAFPDFEDNVKNLDEAVNTADPQWVDRLGRFRLPLMEQERQFVASQDSRDDQFQSSQDSRENQFQSAQSSRDDQFQSAQSSREAVFSNFLQASGYQDLGEYAPGIEITAHNQYVTFGGQPYLLKPSIPVPYTTSGEWTGDDFKLIGDGSLRQDLANPGMGAALVALPNGNVADAINYLTPKMFGAIPRDVESAASNEASILAAIRSGRVLIDDVYYTTLTPNNIIESEIDIHCLETGGLIFINSGGPWLQYKSSERHTLTGCNFVGMAADSNLITVMTPDNGSTVKVGTLRFTGGSCSNNVSLHRAAFPITSNPSVEEYGIDYLVVEKLRVSNCDHSFFTSANMPNLEVELSDLIIRNVSYTAFNFSIFNDHHYLDEMNAAAGSLTVTGCSMVNDDSWYSGSDGSYHVFVLHEGVRCKYEGNHVEGLKSKGVIGVYDLYSSHDVLEYHNNVWKNNICLSPSKQNNELLKSKGSSRTYYSNNVFTVDKEFLALHGADNIDSGWVTLFQKTHGNDNSLLSIKNNEFYLAYFKGQPASSVTKDVFIIDNLFKIGHYLDGGLLVISNSRGGITDYSEAVASFSRNKVYIDVMEGGRFFRMVIDDSEPAGRRRLIEIRDNTFSIGLLKGILSFAYPILADTIDVSDNDISVDDETRLDGGFRPLQFADMKGDRVVFRSKLSALRQTASTHPSFNTELFDGQSCDIGWQYSGEFRSGFIRLPHAKAGEPYTVQVVLKYATGSGVYSGSYIIRVSDTDLHYIDTSGNPASATLPAQTQTITVNSAKVREIDTAFAGLQVRYRNPDDYDHGVHIDLNPSEISVGDRGIFEVSVVVTR